MADPETVVYSISGWRRLLLWPLGLLLRAWGGTLRFEISGPDRTVFEKKDRPVAFVLWHNRLFLTPEFYRRYRVGRPIYGLVSASRDGAWLAAMFSTVGMRAVRGSSSRLGREAAGGLVEVLRAGHDVGITPDGPRGPCYTLKPGALVVARRTGTPILIIGAQFSAAWRLRSWDGFYVPRPFSTIRVRCEEMPADATADGDSLDRIAARLREINPDCGS
jgi:lysophospholipid acyltransferase (LPLAT)-like uncharacterized protein